MAILAAGIGFAIRGGILADWGREFGFTASELGLIGGAGFTGFCFGIIVGGLVADRIGYGKLVVAAFLLHILSAFVTFGASAGMAKTTAYNFLFVGTFIFALANGTLEAVANPLVATLFPNNRTHYLNILHASWPLGLVIGGAMGWILGERLGVGWKIQLGLFLIPTAVYGFLFFGQSYPKSEASQKGLSLGQMFKDVGLLGAAVIAFMLWLFFKDNLGGILGSLTGNEFFGGSAWAILAIVVGVVAFLWFSSLSGFAIGAWLLFVLFITHIMVGAVELGTDQWIQNITGNILTSGEGRILFVFTSLTMFVLRFCADFIEKRIGLSPIGILLVCAVLATVGLNLTAGITTFFGALLALTVYGIGKTFFWPTMLAVVSDRFPRTGAVAISIMGGLGMMSAGLIGSPGLGYAKDRFAGEALQASDPAAFAEYRADRPSKFLFFSDAYGLDGMKLGAAKETPANERTAVKQAVVTADQNGDRKTLRADSFIPAVMAVIYLLLLLYFKAIGGYKPVSINNTLGTAES
ncbi:MAG: MFS transporter [Verrucomicrobiae bacterium]|nr:MFS transporter [Verrucomicrobiae bacterium]